MQSRVSWLSLFFWPVVHCTSFFIVFIIAHRVRAASTDDHEDERLRHRRCRPRRCGDRIFTHMCPVCACACLCTFVYMHGCAHERAVCIFVHRCTLRASARAHTVLWTPSACANIKMLTHTRGRISTASTPSYVCSRTHVLCKEVCTYPRAQSTHTHTNTHTDSTGICDMR